MSLESVGETAGEASSKSVESEAARILVDFEGELGETEGGCGVQNFPFSYLGKCCTNFDFEFDNLIDHPFDVDEMI